MAGGDEHGGVDNEDGYSDEVNEDDTASVTNKARRRGSARPRRAPSVCSSARGSNTFSISRVRLRRASQLAVARKRGPSTPVPSWKVIGDENRFIEPEHHGHSQLYGENSSARRLAAALWEVQAVPFSRGGAPRNRKPHRHHRGNGPSDSKTLEFRIQPSSPGSNMASQRLLKSPAMQNQVPKDSILLTNSASATKSLLKDLEPGAATSNEFVKLLNHELQQNEKIHSMQVEEITNKLVEERAIWQKKQEENVRLAVQAIKEELFHERKAKGRLELLHKRIVKEFQELKKVLGKALHDLERERKARELMEDVCDELAREIGEDKARVEEMKRESAKVREEVEEERKMLQMAEIWREERVQMKLMEAKLELEEKNAALDKLRSELEAFLKAKRLANPDTNNNNQVSTDDRYIEHGIVGHNLAEPFHPTEKNNVPVRHSVDSRHDSISDPKQVLEGEDDASSDSDYFSRSSEGRGMVTASHFQHHGRNEVDVERRAKHWKAVAPSEGRKSRQNYQHHGLQRSRSTQIYDSNRHGDYRLCDLQGGSRWMDDSVEPQQPCEDEVPASGNGARESVNSWPSDNEGSIGNSPFTPRGEGRWRNVGSPYDMAEGLELAGCHTHRLGQKASEVSRELPASSLMTTMPPTGTQLHQQLYAKSSPTRPWTHFWSSPDPGSPRQGRFGRGTSEISSSLKDNSLKAKLMEAKLEGQQARVRSNVD
ncbi:hypothetical protein KP509_09G056400 [Ceratopteris richardii]|uniref:Uncharacterized protein n=1 Tax=Ceratopteris richardii TaxID=49495 RepID=A0A8T2UAP0_CERRI|nr:hypothetical protein KP509_09G056400 [Ceratopteris richardii]